MMNGIGERIRELRKEKRLTQTALAAIMSTTQDTISLWELEKSCPSVADVIKLCEIFNVSADYLLGISEL